MYDTGPWSDMFVASAGAAAALAGLVFVAVSLNIAAIVRTRPFRERALSTVLLLLGAVTVSVLSLSPQPRHALGIELIGLYWLMFGIVGAMVGSVINAWVLLVEILR